MVLQLIKTRQMGHRIIGCRFYLCIPYAHRCVSAHVAGAMGATLCTQSGSLYCTLVFDFPAAHIMAEKQVLIKKQTKKAFNAP